LTRVVVDKLHAVHDVGEGCVELRHREIARGGALRLDG
jgi:hypothetical protein